MNHFIRRIALTTVGLSFALVIPAMAMPSHAPGTHGQPAANAALHQAMRQLWEDHVAWTRLVIVGFAANLPDLEVTTQRLLRNQQDIGDAIKPYYGDAAGERLAQLLREHISGAAALLAAARSGDPAALESARR